MMFVDKTPTRTEFAELGEFAFIEQLAKQFNPKYTHTLKGIGDDAAVMEGDSIFYHLISSEGFLEGVHFDLSYTPLKHLGWKIVAAALSDIYAMNGVPTAITLTIALSNRFSLEAIEELYVGVQAACVRYAVDLVGGDTMPSPKGLFLSITAMGKVEKDQVVYRKGAKPTDIICVTGDLGSAYAGYRILEREKQVYLQNPNIQPDLATYDYVVGRQLKPEAPVEAIAWLRQHGIRPTAMIDISDGLASDLMHICKQSNTGARILEERLPIDWQTQQVAMDFKIDSNAFVFNGGEDYELLFTLPVQQYEQIQSMPNISVIGYMNTAEEGIYLLSKGGSALPIQAQGWQ